MFRNALLCLCLLAACNKAPEQAAPPAATLPAAKLLPSVAALAQEPQAGDLPAIAQAQPAAVERADRAPPPQGLCEVELSGDLEGATVPKGHEFMVYVCEGDCLQGGRVLQRANARGGPRFFTEVFVPCGTSLGVSATVETEASTAPEPTAQYGAAKGSFLAVGQGEIEFKNVHLRLEAGPQRTFAAPPGKNR